MSAYEIVPVNASSWNGSLPSTKFTLFLGDMLRLGRHEIERISEEPISMKLSRHQLEVTFYKNNKILGL